MKTAIVTGGASGIGKSIAKNLAKQNYKVVIVDNNRSALEKVLKKSKEENLNIVGEFVDISSEKSIISAIELIEEHLDKLFLLVNNAGVNFNSTIESCDVAEFDKCISINLRGHYLFTKHVLRFLKLNDGSNIVNISSAHSKTTQPNFFPYNVAKSGIIGLTNSMVIDFSKYGIRANTICPGLIQTNIMSEENYNEESDYFKKVIKYHPVGRLGKPEDIANLVTFISGSSATFINGATIMADGGRSVLTYDI